MLKQLINVWQNNHGTILAVCGAAVAVVMSIAWRLDLIPEIGPSLRSSPILIGERTKPALNIVVVEITSEVGLNADVTLQIFSPPESATDVLTPVSTLTTKLDDGRAEFVITDLPRGVFAALAFMDTSGNNMLDGAEDGTPTEPFCYATTRINDTLKHPGEGVFEVGREPVFIKFHLVYKTPTVDSSSANSSNSQ